MGLFAMMRRPMVAPGASTGKGMLAFGIVTFVAGAGFLGLTLWTGRAPAVVPRPPVAPEVARILSDVYSARHEALFGDRPGADRDRTSAPPSSVPAPTAAPVAPPTAPSHADAPALGPFKEPKPGAERPLRIHELLTARSWAAELERRIRAGESDPSLSDALAEVRTSLAKLEPWAVDHAVTEAELIAGQGRIDELSGRRP